MKLVIVVAALGACGRPAERTAPPHVPARTVVSVADAAIGTKLPSRVVRIEP